MIINVTFSNTGKFYFSIQELISNIASIDKDTLILFSENSAISYLFPQEWTQSEVDREIVKGLTGNQITNLGHMLATNNILIGKEEVISRFKELFKPKLAEYTIETFFNDQKSVLRDIIANCGTTAPTGQKPKCKKPTELEASSYNQVVRVISNLSLLINPSNSNNQTTNSFEKQANTTKELMKEQYNSLSSKTELSLDSELAHLKCVTSSDFEIKAEHIKTLLGIQYKLYLKLQLYQLGTLSLQADNAKALAENLLRDYNLVNTYNSNNVGQYYIRYLQIISAHEKETKHVNLIFRLPPHCTTTLILTEENSSNTEASLTVSNTAQFPLATSTLDNVTTRNTLAPALCSTPRWNESGGLFASNTGTVLSPHFSDQPQAEFINTVDHGGLAHQTASNIAFDTTYAPYTPIQNYFLNPLDSNTYNAPTDIPIVNNQDLMLPAPEKPSENGFEAETELESYSPNFFTQASIVTLSRKRQHQQISDDYIPSNSNM